MAGLAFVIAYPLHAPLERFHVELCNLFGWVTPFAESLIEFRTSIFVGFVLNLESEQSIDLPRSPDGARVQKIQDPRRKKVRNSSICSV
jgi:hypothetical protein